VSTTLQYRVPGMSCEHCVRAVREEVGAVAGVREVDVDLATKAVLVHGDAPDDAAIRAAIEAAGYAAD